MLGLGDISGELNGEPNGDILGSVELEFLCYEDRQSGMDKSK